MTGNLPTDEVPSRTYTARFYLNDETFNFEDLIAAQFRLSFSIMAVSSWSFTRFEGSYNC